LVIGLIRDYIELKSKFEHAKVFHTKVLPVHRSQS
jgi:hypothetical protein